MNDETTRLLASIDKSLKDIRKMLLFGGGLFVVVVACLVAVRLA